jgi:glycosyltransferase involved in cell wall biosynthesis
MLETMTAVPPLVTVIVPARDEAADIEGCLDAIAAQDHPLDRLEVLVVDGCSDDGTADLARRALDQRGFFATGVLSSTGRTASSNLNVGLHRASGDIVCRVDARTRIEPHYVRTCAAILSSHPEVAVVGGAQIAVARDATARAVGIARALNNRWSMGGSAYRRATVSGESDTVYLGAFRRLELLAAGGWDEDLVSNQDFDLNRRMARRGRVWFEASLRSGYLPRPSLARLWQQYLRFGRAKVHYWKHTGEQPEPRQWLLLAVPPVAVAVGVAAVATLGSSGSRSMVVAATALVTVGAIEAKGAEVPEAGLGGHAYGVVSMATVSTGWWWGVVSAALRLSPRGAR